MTAPPLTDAELAALRHVCICTADLHCSQLTRLLDEHAEMRRRAIDAVDLHEKAMTALHERAGIKRDGLAALLAWIDEHAERGRRIDAALALVERDVTYNDGYRFDATSGPEARSILLAVAKTLRGES